MILVTGGLGFIGSKIALSLARAGYEVRILDRCRDARGRLGPHPGGSRCDAASGAADPAASRSRISLVHGDIRDPGICAAACRGIDGVVHCAGINSNDRAWRDPARAIETNVHGTLNMLQGAAGAGASRFVFVSSSKVYGEPARLPSSEDDPARPCDAYGLSKLVGEHYCRQARSEAGLDAVIVRPFSVYGPGQSLSNGYVGRMIRSIVEGERPVLPGRRDFLRDFVHVDDVVEVCVRVALTPERLPPAVNAGSGNGCTLEEMASLASRLSGRRCDPAYGGGRSGMITRSQASRARAEAICGSLRTIPLEVGFSETLEWLSVDRLAGAARPSSSGG